MSKSTELHTETIGGYSPVERMPGHWVLAKIGKRVLRPGGRYLTERMLEWLNIQGNDRVVEFAPGLGLTARQTLKRAPASYIAIEKDENVVRHVRGFLERPEYECRHADAESTDLENEHATIVYGEAMLTMQSGAHKRRIIQEADRILREGGRYAVHEIALTPPDIDPEARKAVRLDLTKTIHHGVNPLTLQEWEQLFAEQGFQVEKIITAPMALLEVKRVIRDEGLFRSLLILARLILQAAVRARVMEMRNMFRKHQQHMLGFIMILKKVKQETAENRSTVQE